MTLRNTMLHVISLVSIATSLMHCEQSIVRSRTNSPEKPSNETEELAGYWIQPDEERTIETEYSTIAFDAGTFEEETRVRVSIDRKPPDSVSDDATVTILGPVSIFAAETLDGTKVESAQKEFAVTLVIDPVTVAEFDVMNHLSKVRVAYSPTVDNLKSSDIIVPYDIVTDTPSLALTGSGDIQLLVTVRSKKFGAYLPLLWTSETPATSNAGGTTGGSASGTSTGSSTASGSGTTSENDDGESTPTWKPQLASGYAHTCALLPSREIKCWGANNYGQLGVGDTDPRGSGSNLLPIQAVDLGTNKLPVELTAGDRHNCVRFEDGTVKCWGYAGSTGTAAAAGVTSSHGDEAGEMGDDLPEVNLGTGKKAIQIVSGDFQNCAILEDRSLKCWGSNNYGVLGLGDSVSHYQSGQMGDNLPAVNLGANQKVIKVSTAWGLTCAMLEDNNIKCWGSSATGGLGAEYSDDQGDKESEMGDNLDILDFGSETVSDYWSGAGQACVRFTTEQTRCWGASAAYLGNGTSPNIGNDNGEMGANIPILNLGLGRVIGRVAFNSTESAYHICALLDNGRVKCWGNGSSGALGNASANTVGSDQVADYVDLGFTDPVIALSVGSLFSCAMIADGTVKCWGENISGQLGIGDNAPRGDNANEMGSNLMPVAF